LLFGNYDGYLQNLTEVYGPDYMTRCLADDKCKKRTLDDFNDTKLLDGYDAYLGNQPGDVQICHGDSGGPLLQKTGDSFAIYGVASSTWQTVDNACYGNFYAVFGQSATDLLTSATAWTDPCAGATSDGTCTGTVATRCSAKWEGD